MNLILTNTTDPVHSHDRIALLQGPDAITLIPGQPNRIQRDLLPSPLHLARLLYPVDMALHIDPVDDAACNSECECRVQWWRRSRSGKLESGRGFIKLASGSNQLVYVKDVDGAVTGGGALPQSTFNLFASSERQREQRAEVMLPHYRAQREQDEEVTAGGEPGFDSDDPDADLDF
jgi:hypothetical protein